MEVLDEYVSSVRAVTVSHVQYHTFFYSGTAARKQTNGLASRLTTGERPCPLSRLYR